jgi:hypothetical protein
MATKNEELRGALFPNKDKQPGDKRPDFTGYAQVQGVRYRASAWTRTAKKSRQQFLSITLELPQANGTAAPATPQPGTVSVNFPITLTPEQAQEQARIDRLAQAAPAPAPTDMDAIARLLEGGSR